MTPAAGTGLSPAEVFKALGDPVRWSIVQQLAEVDELACGTLEGTLPIAKPTISYHTKILTQAGLISVRRQGRNFFYALRRDALDDLMKDVWKLASPPRPDPPGPVDPDSDPPRPARSGSPAGPAGPAGSGRRRAARPPSYPKDSTGRPQAPLLTW